MNHSYSNSQNQQSLHKGYMQNQSLFDIQPLPNQSVQLSRLVDKNPHISTLEQQYQLIQYKGQKGYFLPQESYLKLTKQKNQQYCKDSQKLLPQIYKQKQSPIRLKEKTSKDKEKEQQKEKISYQQLQKKYKRYKLRVIQLTKQLKDVYKIYFPDRKQKP